MSHKAEIIAVGSELLLGNVANTDARYVSEKIASAGVDVLYHTAVGDNPQRLRQVTDIARSRCDLLIFIGGLGPTYDDLTKETVCAAFGLELEFHQDVMEEIKAYFKNVFRREMPDCNRRQAFLPRGCAVFHNPVGTAPGCLFTVEGVTVAMLPGVPHECRYLTDHALLPYLQARQEGVILSHTLHVFGLTEPKVQELLDDLMDSAQNPSLAPYAKAAEVQLRITAKAETAEMCETLMAPLLAEVRRRLGEHICGVDMGDPEVCAVKTLKARSLTVSAAESCTGGLIAKRITDVAGGIGGFSRGRGVLYQRGQGKHTGGARRYFGTVWCCVGAGGQGHGRGRPAHYEKRPGSVGDGPGRSRRGRPGQSRRHRLHRSGPRAARR